MVRVNERSRIEQAFVDRLLDRFMLAYAAKD